jgi:hypothetical protein
MNASTELEALEMTRERIESVERRRPWLIAEATMTEERGRSRVDAFFSVLQRYMEQNRVEPYDIM